MLAAIGGALAIPFAAKAAGPRFIGRLPKHPIDVTGKPTPHELIQGVSGVTHFDVETWNAAERTNNSDLYLDGVCVTGCSSECDLVAGWVRMFDAKIDPKDGGANYADRPPIYLDKPPTWGNTKGEWVYVRVDPIWTLKDQIHFGRVEVRGKIR